jgi:RNA polymerase sigma-70 factor (ECF subfamily)
VSDAKRIATYAVKTPMGRELVERAMAGDRDAFVTLARAAYDPLLRIARLILRDEHGAADAVQEALTSAWLNVGALRDPERFDAWLTRLTVRASYRESRRHRGRVVEVALALVDVTDRRNVIAVIDDRDRIERGFRRLNPQQRAVLVVHHYLDLSDAEAAAALSIPVGTMKSRLNRATTALRAAIEADDRAGRLPDEVPA